jgi:RNA polymerase sigma-70 factor, ECF subfamily
VDQRRLVERAKRGDRDAFAVLVTASAGRLLGVSRLILGDAELAHDAAQEALVRAWRDLPGLRDADRFDGWLHRLTVNACLDLARRRRRRPVEIDLADLDAPSQVDHAADLATRDVLDRGLRRLNPEWRAVIVLHYYVGLPLPEVAAILRIPLGTAKSRLNRSLTLLRAVVVGPDAGREPAREGQPS